MARELSRKVYGLTQMDKFARDFGLKRQIQDAADSSMNKINKKATTNPEPLNPEL